MPELNSPIRDPRAVAADLVQLAEVAEAQCVPLNPGRVARLAVEALAGVVAVLDAAGVLQDVAYLWEPEPAPAPAPSEPTPGG